MVIRADERPPPRWSLIVTYDEADGAACRFAFKHAAEQFHLVCLLARGRYLALSRSATVQFVLDEVEIDVDACRHTIDDASYCCSVTLAKRGQCE